jgi:hypothetical protein
MTPNLYPPGDCARWVRKQNPYVILLGYRASWWDNEANIRKHGFDFQDAWEVFQGPLLPRLDQREDYGEGRWQGIGLLGGQVVVVIFAYPMS